MSVSVPRVSKRAKKPSAKRPASARPRNAQTQSSSNLPSVSSSANSDMFSDIHRELESLRQQVSQMRDSQFTVVPPLSIASSSPVLSSTPATSAGTASFSTVPLTVPYSSSAVALLPPASSDPLNSIRPATHVTSSVSAVSSTSSQATVGHASSLVSPSFSSLHVTPTTSPISSVLPTEELLAARNSDSDSDAGESSAVKAGKRLHRPTVSMSGSLGAAATLGGIWG